MNFIYTNYTFDASAQTIVFTGYTSLPKKVIKLIVNVEDGLIIYNFADATKGGTITADAGGDILTLEYDTTSMSDTDELMIVLDDLNANIDSIASELIASNDKLTFLSTQLPSALGQTIMDGSLSVTIASDQNAISVEGTVDINSIPAGTNNIGDVDIASIAAGDNNIGNVDVVTLPSIPAGNNNIGDVDVASLPALVAGTAIIGKVGIDQTTPGTTNGVQVNAALPAGTNAIGKLAANDGVDIGDVTINNSSIPVTDNSGSLTVDAPVGTPVFVRLSDGSSAIATLPVSLASVPSHAVTNVGTFAVQDSEKIADNAGFTDGATKVLPTGYIYDEVAGTALTENDIAAARINANRAQVSTIEDGTTRGRYATVTAANALKVDASGVAVPVTDNSGSLTVDAPVGTPVFATLTPSTTGGWDTFMASSSDGSTALTNSAQAIKGSAGTFGGYYIYNPNSSAVYVHIYDVASGSVTVGTTNPKNTFCIPATSGANLEITNGIKYSTAMSCAATTTGGGNTAPSTALEANFFYK